VIARNVAKDSWWSRLRFRTIADTNSARYHFARQSGGAIAHEARQHLDRAGGADAAVDVDRQSFFGELVGHGQDLNCWPLASLNKLSEAIDRRVGFQSTVWPVPIVPLYPVDHQIVDQSSGGRERRPIGEVRIGRRARPCHWSWECRAWWRSGEGRGRCKLAGTSLTSRTRCHVNIHLVDQWVGLPRQLCGNRGASEPTIITGTASDRALKPL